MNASILSPLDLSRDEIYGLFEKTKYLKSHPISNVLRGKSLAMIFQKPSTRTRVSFEVGMTQLGGRALYVNSSDLQLSRGETIADTARVLGSYVDCIMARVNKHQDVVELSKHAKKPVINGLSDLHHPCQALADIYTLWESCKTLKNKTITFVGDGDNNVTNSLLLLSVRLEMNFTVASPRGYETKPEIINEALREAQITKSTVTVLNDPKKAVKNTDVLVTDVWVSMGRTDEKQRLQTFPPYQINKQLLSLCPEAKILHCLPAHRGQEITSDVLDGKQSLVWSEAENRLHVQKALLLALFDKNP
jgi:ornithine carbamoyltransferase